MDKIESLLKELLEQHQGIGHYRRAALDSGPGTPSRTRYESEMNTCKKRCQSIRQQIVDEWSKSLARIEQLEAEAKVTDQLLETRMALVDAIPDCPAHGPQCVCHAVEWVENIQAENASLWHLPEEMRRFSGLIVSGGISHMRAWQRSLGIAIAALKRREE